jgi:sirohydrochlorin cobaltochelatase
MLNSGLVLVGHGSTKNADSRRSVELHARELRRRGLFAEVLACYYKEPPWVKEVWDRTTARELFVIPVFMSEGYFTKEVIPKELGLQRKESTVHGRMTRRGQRLLWYGDPVGTHPSMTRLLLARAERALIESPGTGAPRPEDTALMIAGHGTPRNDRSREVIDRQVEIIRRLGVFAEVHAAFMEEELQIGNYHQFVQARNLVVVPFFVSDGMHVREDIPVLLGEQEEVVRDRLGRGEPVWLNPAVRRGKRIWYTRSVGMDPLLAEVILERVMELKAEGKDHREPIINGD